MRAVYKVNDYLWNGPTQLKTLIDRAESPFYPVQQQPEANFNLPIAPYIIYSARTVPGMEQYYIMEDRVLYTAWGKSQDVTVPIVWDMIRHLRRLDESATDLNDYLRSKDDNRFEFLWLRVNDSIDPLPVDQEGGDYGRRLTVSYSYIDKELC